MCVELSCHANSLKRLALKTTLKAGQGLVRSRIKKRVCSSGNGGFHGVKMSKQEDLSRAQQRIFDQPFTCALKHAASKLPWKGECFSKLHSQFWITQATVSVSLENGNKCPHTSDSHFFYTKLHVQLIKHTRVRESVLEYFDSKKKRLNLR